MFRNYIIGLFWFLIFWAGMTFLFGLGAGLFASWHAASLPDAVKLGGMAGIEFTRNHGRLIIFISGFLVTWAMTRGLLPGSPNRKQRKVQANAKQIQERALRLRQEALEQIEKIKALAVQKNPKASKKRIRPK